VNAQHAHGKCGFRGNRLETTVLETWIPILKKAVSLFTKLLTDFGNWVSAAHPWAHDLHLMEATIATPNKKPAIEAGQVVVV
jgi:hypothetical protein